jgi:hypothetical protein
MGGNAQKPVISHGSLNHHGWLNWTTNADVDRFDRLKGRRVADRARGCLRSNYVSAVSTLRGDDQRPLAPDQAAGVCLAPTGVPLNFPDLRAVAGVFDAILLRLLLAESPASSWPDCELHGEEPDAAPNGYISRGGPSDLIFRLFS